MIYLRIALRQKREPLHRSADRRVPLHRKFFFLTYLFYVADTALLQLLHPLRLTFYQDPVQADIPAKCQILRKPHKEPQQRFPDLVDSLRLPHRDLRVPVFCLQAQKHQIIAGRIQLQRKFRRLLINLLDGEDPSKHLLQKASAGIIFVLFHLILKCLQIVLLLLLRLDLLPDLQQHFPQAPSRDRL